MTINRGFYLVTGKDVFPPVPIELRNMDISHLRLEFSVPRQSVIVNGNGIEGGGDEITRFLNVKNLIDVSLEYSTRTSTT